MKQSCSIELLNAPLIPDERVLQARSYSRSRLRDDVIAELFSSEVNTASDLELFVGVLPLDRNAMSGCEVQDQTLAQLGR